MWQKSGLLEYTLYILRSVNSVLYTPAAPELERRHEGDGPEPLAALLALERQPMDGGVLSGRESGVSARRRGLRPPLRPASALPSERSSPLTTVAWESRK